MAKPATKTKTPPPKPDTARAVTTTAKTEVGVADDLLKMMEADAGKGVSTAAEDNIVPLLYVLQKGSPQIDRSEPVFIKGAKAGDAWLRGTTVFQDCEDEGLEVVPCHFSKCWIQWRANRGGFVTRHREKPSEARQVPDAKKPDKMVWRMPNERGEFNDTCDAVVETREYAVIITSLAKPFTVVVPFSSTGHTPAKEWMGLINSKVMPNGKTFPIYSHKYKLMTIPKKNDDGSWYQWLVKDAGGGEEGAEPLVVMDMELYKAAKKINTDFTSGALVADAGEPSSETSGVEDDNDM